MFPEFKELLCIFNAHNVKYLIVGGYAVGFHAQPRATKDLDRAWEGRVEAVVDEQVGVRAFFISAKDLIASKLAAGRPQDIADAEAVRSAEKKTPPGD